MGWGSGSSVMNAIIAAVQPEVKNKEKRKAIYEPIADMMMDNDWDTVDESMGIDPAFDEMLREKFPDWFDDSEEDQD